MNVDPERLQVHADKALLDLAAQLYVSLLVLEARGEIAHADTLAELLHDNEEFLRRRIQQQTQRALTP